MILLDRYDYKPPASHPASQHPCLAATDGDTLAIIQKVRLVSCDTPEKSYAGGLERTEELLALCRRRLEGRFYAELPEELREYLLARLGRHAAQRHLAAAEAASVAFAAMLERRLTRADGKRRDIAVVVPREALDRNGRLLAYLAPWFAGNSLDPLPPRDAPERRTLNLEMIESGHAAFFPIYPSLPKGFDMLRAARAAESAWREKRGAWKTPRLLLGYELRMCVKLAREKTPSEGIAKAFPRGCIDLASMEDVGPCGFPQVPPSRRLWYWLADAREALAKLGSTPRVIANVG